MPVPGPYGRGPAPVVAISSDTGRRPPGTLPGFEGAALSVDEAGPVVEGVLLRTEDDGGGGGGVGALSSDTVGVRLNAKAGGSLPSTLRTGARVRWSGGPSGRESGLPVADPSRALR